MIQRPVRLVPNSRSASGRANLLGMVQCAFVLVLAGDTACRVFWRTAHTQLQCVKKIDTNYSVQNRQ